MGGAASGRSRWPTRSWSRGTDCPPHRTCDERGFALAVCPQIGFSVVPDPPFIGRKGRQRLAVLDGVADEETIRAVVSHLDNGELAVVVAKAATREAEAALTRLSPGSRLWNAPQDILRQSVAR